MNNRFKFRVWDKANNKFINPFLFEHNNYYKDTGMMLLDFNGKIRIAEYSSGCGDNSASSVYSEVDNQDDYEIQQYTGLTDCKGNPIYEGDIIYHKNYKVYCQCVWDVERLTYRWVGKNVSLPIDTRDDNMTLKEKIVGNIFEHKHLIEK